MLLNSLPHQFSNMAAVSAPIHAFLGVTTTSITHNIFLKKLVAFLQNKLKRDLRNLQIPYFIVQQPLEYVYSN